MKAKYIDNLYKEKVVSTEGELKKAIRENYGKIVVQGNLIKKTQSIYKMRNIAYVACARILPSERNILGKDRHTIISYLRRGYDAGICQSFSNNESIYRGNNPYLMVLKNTTIIGVFRHIHRLCDVSQELFGEIFHMPSVRMCYDKQKTYKGYYIKRITREEYLQYKMIKNIEVVKEVISNDSTL